MKETKIKIILKDSEEHKIAFPSVARSFTVINRATPDIRVHFHSTSSYSTVIDDKHYITLDSTNTSVTMNVKCKEIYITRDPSIEASTDAQYEIFAELTQIAVEECAPRHSPSNLKFQTLRSSGHSSRELNASEHRA